MDVNLKNACERTCLRTTMFVLLLLPSCTKYSEESPTGEQASVGTRSSIVAWSPDLVPEMVLYDFRQEDVAVGPVMEWKSRGVWPRSATGKATKLPDGGGVLFASGTSESLTWPIDNYGPWRNRWWIVIARADMAGVTEDIPALTVNGAAGGANHRQPYVRFNGKQGKLQSILNNPSGTAIQEEDYSNSFAAWNIVVGFRRGGQYHAWINGVKQPPLPFTGMVPCRDRQAVSGMGANSIAKTLSANMAIDCVIVGQGELNDAEVDKLVGWAHWRAGRQDLLPPGHPYKAAPPKGLDADDKPSLFTFDSAVWSNWVKICDATKKANRGNSPPGLDDGKGNDYSVVFFDDFKTDSVVDDLTGDSSAAWFCPTHMGNIIDVDALAQRRSDRPATYIHDASGSGTLTLRMLDVNGRWKSGAFSSVNHEGQGRSWGKGRFMIRCKFPRMDSPRPGFFPAFWSYDNQHLFWQTRNRIEMDFFEYDGVNGTWINTSQHIHAPPIPTNLPGIRQRPDIGYKIAGRSLIPKHNFNPTIDIYDGQYHVWEFRIEDDFTYVIVDDKEVVRVPTTDWLLVKKYIMIDWALRAKEHPPVPGQAYDMTIDWIEVQQRERDMALVPKAFNARPTLSGARGMSHTITCTPNVAASQIEYRWYKNGEPIVGATQATFVEDATSVNQALRCHVRAVSLLNQPEAWTEEIKPVGTAVQTR